MEYLAVRTPLAASCAAPSCASSARPGWARPPWGAPSPAPWGARSCASPSAACATRRRSGATGAPTWGPCRGASCAGHARRRRASTRCSCWTRSTSWGVDFRGDPSSALLEVLDPEQNHAFSDHYLEVPFDLSRVLFITTANLLDPIPPALRDRMEVIDHPGVHRRGEGADRRATSSSPASWSSTASPPTGHLRFTDDALRHLIREYTREAGVRNLEREVAHVCRKVARRVADADGHAVRRRRAGAAVGAAGGGTLEPPLPRARPRFDFGGRAAQGRGGGGLRPLRSASTAAT